MRIQSMDASAVQLTKAQETNTKDTVKIDVKDNVKISQISEFEKRELPISERLVINAIEKANKAIEGSNRKFEFSIHEGTKEIMVKVLDSETNEVVREIPPEKILDLVAKMWEMAGIVVDERR